MNDSKPDRIWDLFVELRKELVESQKIRSQVIGFKITFVTAAIGLIAVNITSLDKALFVIPAFAAICLDLIIYSSLQPLFSAVGWSRTLGIRGGESDDRG